MYITLSSVSVPIYSVFFLMIPPPPRSTLFPYTTLFRSLDQIVVVLAGQPGHQQSAGEAQLMTGLANGHPGGPRRGGGDRKSTRLNSSHSQISYAVFCLKKKKNSKSYKPARQ